MRKLWTSPVIEDEGISPNFYRVTRVSLITLSGRFTSEEIRHSAVGRRHVDEASRAMNSINSANLKPFRPSTLKYTIIQNSSGSGGAVRGIDLTGIALRNRVRAAEPNPSRSIGGGGCRHLRKGRVVRD